MITETLPTKEEVLESRVKALNSRLAHQLDVNEKLKQVVRNLLELEDGEYTPSTVREAMVYPRDWCTGVEGRLANISARSMDEVMRCQNNISYLTKRIHELDNRLNIRLTELEEKVNV